MQNFFLLTPTAAAVSVSGRVSTASGLRNAVVYSTKTIGETVSTRTGTFGAYRFNGIEAEQTVIIGVNSRLYQFAPQIIDLTDNPTDLNFTALE